MIKGEVYRQKYRYFYTIRQNLLKNYAMPLKRYILQRLIVSGINILINT